MKNQNFFSKPSVISKTNPTKKANTMNNDNEYLLKENRFQPKNNDQTSTVPLSEQVKKQNPSIYWKEILDFVFVCRKQKNKKWLSMNFIFQWTFAAVWLVDKAFMLIIFDKKLKSILLYVMIQFHRINKLLHFMVCFCCWEKKKNEIFFVLYISRTSSWYRTSDRNDCSTFSSESISSSCFQTDQ